MFSKFTTRILQIFVIIIMLTPFVVGSDPLSPDTRHQFVKKVRSQYADEIIGSKGTLKTTNDAIALIDIARIRLRGGVFVPFEPDWALVIRRVSLGYGFDEGISTSLKVNDAERDILLEGYVLSSSYLRAQGHPPFAEVAEAHTPLPIDMGIVEAHLHMLNQAAAAVSADAYSQVERMVLSMHGLTELRTFNAWFAHERFWAIGGVLAPHIFQKQREAFEAYKGTPMGFLTDLSVRLDGLVRACPGVGEVASEALQDLVMASQQILLTIAAGTPTVDTDGYVCLDPRTAADWQLIRKALFLALSVTSDPEKSGFTFLSPLFDCSTYYPAKTAPDSVKTYYWQVQALAKGFSKLWPGLKAGQANAELTAGLRQVIDKADPMSFWPPAVLASWSIERGTSYPVLKMSYEQAVSLVSVSDARAELAAVLALHPKLNYQQAFRTLYPTLTAWAEYHLPSNRATTLMEGAKRANMALPKGFVPERLFLKFEAGKWSLKGVPSAASGGAEQVLWRQGASAAQEFIGELEDTRGTHLFNFRVNGPQATIKVISTGYIFNADGEGAEVVVAHGEKELGLIESSAYPLYADIFTNEADSAIFIKGASYRGMRGVVQARRDSVIIHAPSINLWYQEAFEKRTHTNGAEYNFYQPGGHGIEAHKDVLLYGDDIHIPHAKVVAGQDIYCGFINPDANFGLVTHGSIVTAGGDILFNHSGWHADTETTFAGYREDYVPVPHQTVAGLQALVNALTYKSARASIAYGRSFTYRFESTMMADEEELALLAKGPHAYGSHGSLTKRKPTFTVYTLPPPQPAYDWREERDRMYNRPGVGRPGMSQGPSDFGSRLAAAFAPASMPMMSSGGELRLQEVNVAASSRGGITRVGGAVTLASPMGDISLGDTTLGFNYRSGEGTRSLDLFSTFVPPTLAESIRLATMGIDPTAPNAALALHTMASAAILQLTDRSSRMSMRASDLSSGGIFGGPLVTIGVIGLDLAKKASDGGKDALDAKGRADWEKRALAAMPPMHDPDDDEGRKKAGKPEDNWNSWQNLPKEIHEGKEYARIGDRLYTQHAVDRMQPSGLGTPAGQIGAGKSIAPRFVEDIIKTGVRRLEVDPSGIQRSIIRSGDFEVVTENLDRIIVTVKRINP